MTAFGKGFCVFGVAALTLSLGFGQSLVDAAKKEKERRDGQQGKHAITVTNATLSAVKKKPAVTSETATDLPVEGEAAAPGAKPQAAPGTKTQTAPAAAKTAPPPGPEPESPPAVSPEDQKADLQAKYDRAKERVELLNLKMLSLRQQLTTFNSMQTKDQVQKDMSETYQRLLEAQLDATKAKDDLDKLLSQQAKDRGASIWIR